MTTSGHGPLTGQIVVSDGATLVYDILNPQGRTTVVLIHGWSGSRRYFRLNARDIAAAGHRVIAYDQRFHGDSSRPGHGHSVARLAADLQTLLEKLEVRNACCVGTSMGAAVIWAYQELFGTGDRIASIVTVDQGMYGDNDAAGSRQFSRAPACVCSPHRQPRCKTSCLGGGSAARAATISIRLRYSRARSGMTLRNSLTRTPPFVATRTISSRKSWRCSPTRR